MGSPSTIVPSGKAAVLVIDNAQGVEINKSVHMCLADKGFPYTGELPSFKIPAEVLNAIGWVLYYPLLAQKYEDVSVVIGKDQAEFTQKLKRSADRFANVDVFVMAHTNLFDGRKLAGAPAVEIKESLTEEERGHLRFIYSMGCNDGNEGSALSMRAIGFKSFVGHKGISANYLVTKAFLERWLFGNTDLKQASGDAYSEARLWVKQQPAWVRCLLTPGFTDYAEVDGMEPALYGANIAFGQNADIRPVDFEEMIKEIKTHHYTDSRGGPPRECLNGKFDLTLTRSDSSTECLSENDRSTVGVLAQYLSSERLMEMARDEKLSLPIRWAFVDGLSVKPDAEILLRKIVEDTRLSLRVRKEALFLYMSATQWDVLPFIKESLRSQQLELEMLHAVIINFGRTLDPSLARKLIPDLKKLNTRKGLHPKIRQSIDYTFKAIQRYKQKLRKNN